ncbi:MAG TPA: serine/threonine-protein kinase [Candidatus Obscuribacterales bacterium]
MLQAQQILSDRYQLKQKLGQNAGRQTWLATDIGASPQQEVIVKFLAFGGEVQWDDLKLFEREAQILKQLNHPRIPKYRDYFSLDDKMLWFGLVQEYIPGASLKEQLNQGKRFTEPQVRKIAVDVLEILTYLHQLNPVVLHRDIKPSNLIWGEDEQVYLVDFGAVQDRAAKEGATFTVVGTYGYAPMEQFGGRAIPASDLYALGATLIHLLTGTSPADLPQKDLRIQFSDKVSLNPSFLSWIEHLTEPVPERRCTTAPQALETLKSGIFLSSQTPKSAQTAKFFRPTKTLIELSKSAEELEIKIPKLGSKGIHIMPIVLLGKLVTVYAFSTLVIMTLFFGILEVGLFLSIGLLLLIVWLIVIILWGRTSLNFNRNHFQIKRQVFNFIYSELNYPTSRIKYVICRERDGKREVVIQVVKSDSDSLYSSRGDCLSFSFGEGLTPDEQAWLTQEIQTWLNFI